MDDPSVTACAMAAVFKRAKAVARTIIVGFMVASFLVDDLQRVLSSAEVNSFSDS
jgi:hypothetical protein